MIFSILAFLTLFISICIKERNKSLLFQSINCIFQALYDLTINAYTSSIIGFTNFIRSSLFRKKEYFSKFCYLILLVIFETIIILNCVFTWNGYISLLPTITAGVRTYCLWQSNMKYVRLSGMLSGILYGLYYIYYQSPLMTIGYLLLFVISLYNVLKNDLKTKPITAIQ